MHECRYCAAPVDRRTGACTYCRSRLELDLHGSLDYRLYEPESERICPDCNVPLSTIDLEIEKKCLIEKCEQCSGLFFDPGELEMILEKSVSNIFHVDEPILSELQSKNFAARGKNFRYRKCPCCQVIMNRENFGYKSAVIVDKCRTHGYWLDENELRQLQEWKKAGGELRQKEMNLNSKGKSKNQSPSRTESLTSTTSTGINKTNRTSTDGISTSLNVLDLFSSFFD